MQRQLISADGGVLCSRGRLYSSLSTKLQPLEFAGLAIVLVSTFHQPGVFPSLSITQKGLYTIRTYTCGFYIYLYYFHNSLSSVHFFLSFSIYKILNFLSFSFFRLNRLLFPYNKNIIPIFNSKKQLKNKLKKEILNLKNNLKKHLEELENF